MSSRGEYLQEQSKFLYPRSRDSSTTCSITSNELKGYGENQPKSKKKKWNEKDYQGKKTGRITSPTILFCCAVEPLVGNLAAITQWTQGPAQQYCSCSDKRENKKKIRCEKHKQAFICSLSLSLKLRDSQDWGFSCIFRFNWEFSHPVNLLNISIY